MLVIDAYETNVIPFKKYFRDTSSPIFSMICNLLFFSI